MPRPPPARLRLVAGEKDAGAPLARFVAEKGSVAVDGVSLTVTAVGADWFEVGLIPETLRATTWGIKGPGARVNVEADILGKHVARLLQFRT